MTTTWIIAEKTFLRNILDSRFIIASMLVILLMWTSGLLMSHELEERRHDDFRRRLSAANNIEQTEITKTPSPLAFVADGGEAELPWTVTVKAEYIDTSIFALSRQSLIESFPLIDWTYIVAVVMSLMALFFSYDLVAGEKESGLLASQLSQPIRRSDFIMGSYLGVVLSFFPVLLVGLLGSFLIVLVMGSVAMNLDYLARLGLTVLLALLYVSIFVLLGLLISNLFHQSAAALISSLMIWTLLVMIIPQGSEAVAVASTRLPTDQQLQREINRLREQLGRFSVSTEMIQEIVLGSSNPSEKQQRINELASELELRAEAQQQEMERRIGSLIRDFSHQRDQQVFLAHRLARLSPTAVFQFTVGKMSNTGLWHHWRFLEQAQRYQSLFAEYSFQRKRENREKAMPVIQGSASMGGYTLSVVFKRDYSRIVIEPNTGPVFVDEWPPLRESLGQAWIDIGLLMTFNLLLFVLAHVRFLYYDVR